MNLKISSDNQLIIYAKVDISNLLLPHLFFSSCNYPVSTPVNDALTSSNHRSTQIIALEDI